MNARPQLKHVGLYVHDMARMEAFYADVFDLMVTDRGQVPRLGNRNIVFMSAAADAHHQMVLIDGKDPASGPSVVFQLSFYVQTLDELRRIDAKMRAQGVTDITPITHGPAQIALKNRPEIGEILNPNRFIQPPGGAKSINRFRWRVSAHDDLCGVTGKAQHNESEGDHHGNGERSARQA
jgi:catechol 2,3-dioxygenase-like lactoylglutathione lyase family enzyme